MIEILKEDFYKYFGDFGEIKKYFAPGRVNIIGEHIDYNGGMVLPCALTIGTYGLIRLRDDNIVSLYSYNFPTDGVKSFNIDNYDFDLSWTDYVKAMLKLLDKEGFAINKGFDMYFYGNIPNGSGLSSSASLTVLLGCALNDLYHLGYNNVDIAKLGQSCEHLVGVNCGIMDHFASANGKEKHAIYLNTATLDFTYIPMDFKNYQLVVVNTNKKRKLTDSKYNERRFECDSSLALLKKHYEIDELCELSSSDLGNIQKILNNDVWFKRVRHAISENERVKEACECMTRQDIRRLGELLSLSHQSLKEDYEVTGIELDTIVESLQLHKEVIGARMVGAGFGGCAIALIEKENVEKVMEEVIIKYKNIIGYDPTYYCVEIGDGVHKI